MANRNVLNVGIRVASALTLLVAVMTSPIRHSVSIFRSSPLNHLHHNLAIPSTNSTHQSAKSVAPRGFVVKALRSESEELSRTACPARCSFDLSPSLEPSARDLATSGLIRVPHPLRC